jgi:GNAT superfamily N-acetyltransferase
MKFAEALDAHSFFFIRREAKEYGVDIVININDKENLAVINSVKVDEEFRNQGRATKVLRKIVKKADEVGCILALSATDEWGSDLERLKKLYKKFGFVENSGSNLDSGLDYNMYRKPKKR